jgi:hypothetical protein
VCLCATAAFALDPQKAITQFVHTAGSSARRDRADSQYKRYRDRLYGSLYASMLLVQMLRLSLLISIVFLPFSTVLAQAAQSDSPRVLQESWTPNRERPNT